MRLIDKNALLEKIDQNAYLVRYDFGFTSIEKGMTITGIRQALDEAPTIDAVEIDRVLEIIAELKSENIGRDGSDEYTSACQDFRAAVIELKGDDVK